MQQPSHLFSSTIATYFQCVSQHPNQCVHYLCTDTEILDVRGPQEIVSASQLNTLRKFSYSYPGNWIKMLCLLKG